MRVPRHRKVSRRSRAYGPLMQVKLPLPKLLPLTGIDRVSILPWSVVVSEIRLRARCQPRRGRLRHRQSLRQDQRRNADAHLKAALGRLFGVYRPFIHCGLTVASSNARNVRRPERTSGINSGAGTSEIPTSLTTWNTELAITSAICKPGSELLSANPTVTLGTVAARSRTAPVSSPAIRFRSDFL